MSYDILLLLGRIIFGGFFVINSANHLFKTQMLAGYAASKGVASPRLAVIVSGLFILLGGLGVILGIFIEWAVLLLTVFLLVVSYKIHHFWKIDDPQMKVVEMTQFMKNMALLGAALMLLSIPQPWAYSLSF